MSHFQILRQIAQIWHFWWTFVHSKSKRSSLRSQCWMRLFQRFSNSVLFCSIFKSHFVEACLLILTSNKKWSSITGWIQFRISMHNPIMELYLYAKRQIENVKGPRDLTEKWTWWSLRNAKTCREPLVKTFCLYTENNQTTSQSKRKLRSKQTDSLITTTNMVQHLQGVQASLE